MRIGAAAATIATSLVCMLSGSRSAAQAPTAPIGWELSGIPALNYNSDEGFGYGVVANLYYYGASGKLPYVVTVQPTVFLTTGGRRDYTLFFDAPNVGGSAWRVDAYFGHETRLAAPYYGIGNATTEDASRETAPNQLYYRYGRRRVQFTSNLQRTLGHTPMRLLFGVAVAQVNVTEIPRGTTATFLSDALSGAAPPNGSSNYVRVGLVWDTRDREVHTSHGTWADLLVEDVTKSMGSDWNYTRATLTVRQYAALSSRVTFAERVVAQNVAGDAPFYDLAIVQTSFTPQEGLGGANTLRGLPQDRYVGKGLALSNSEVRWRAKEFTLLGKPSTLTLSGFVDAGRVWTDRLDVSTIASDLHVGYGGGVRVGRGPNFVVALDMGHSTEAALPIYIGLGFLF
jgi:hypothetical protein